VPKETARPSVINAKKCPFVYLIPMVGSDTVSWKCTHDTPWSTDTKNPPGPGLPPYPDTTIVPTPSHATPVGFTDVHVLRSVHVVPVELEDQTPADQSVA